MNSSRTVRIGLILIIVFVVFAGAAALLVRRALDPATLRPIAEARLSAALGQPVSIGKMEVSLFPAPVVEAGEIRVGAASGEAAPSLGLQRLRIVPKLASVLSTPIVVERIELDGLALRARRDREGRWILPLPSASQAEAVPASRTSAASASRPTVDIGEILLREGSVTVVDDLPLQGRPKEGASLRRIDARMRVQGGTATLERLSAALGSSTLAGRGSASPGGLRFSLGWDSLKPADLPEVFALLGTAAPAGLSIEGPQPLSLDLAIDAGGALSAAGKLAATRVAFGTLTLTSLASPIRFAENRLVLEPLTFAAYGGQQAGAIRAEVGGTPIGWSLRSSMDKVDLNQLISANTSMKDKLEGSGRLRLNVAGTSAAPVEQQVTGTIEALVSNGVLRDFPLIANLNAALKLTGSEDKDLRFEVLSGTFHLAQGRATTGDLLARSGDLTLKAAGTFRFDQALDFTGTATFTRDKSDDLVRKVKDLGGLRNPQGEIEVPFSVAGTASAPTFAIDVKKMLGRAVEKEMKRQVDKGLKRWLKIK